MPNDAPSTDQSPTRDNRQPIDRCPVCRYSLRGLPSAHCCPECGFEYDEHTRVWKPTRIFALRHVGSIMIVFAGLLLIGSLESTYIPIHLRLIIQVPIATVIVIALLAIYRTKPFIAVTPNGIMFRWLRRMRIVEWSRIERAADADANVIERNSSFAFTDYMQFLPDKSAQAEFRRAVNDGVARYNPPANSESPAHAVADTIESSTTSTERSHTDAG